MTRRGALALLGYPVCAGQLPLEPPPVEFICPMDPDVRSKSPGKCPKCGMALEARIPAPVAYPLQVSVDPRNVPAGQPLGLEFRVNDPKTGAPVNSFEIVHEKYCHLFTVSRDLDFFAHEHPRLDSDGVFRHGMTLPRPGHYKFVADFYPAGGTPQLISKIVTTAGYTKSFEESCTRPAEDLAPKRSANLEVALKMEPARPIAGKKTLLFFHLDHADGLEPYLGAWAHMLIASNDFLDAGHMHPAFANGGSDVQFNVFFPRQAIYRIWVQFQRKGQVNTAAFTIPVSALG